MMRIIKITDTEEGALVKRISNSTVHTACSTDLKKNLFLIDSHDVHIFDIESAHEDNISPNSWLIERVVTHKDMQI